MKYAEKLKDPRWQRFRLQVFEKDNWECLRCDCADKTLHAHHLEYEDGKDPWEYDIGNIVTLCEDCHSLAHDEKNSEQIFKEIHPLSRDEFNEVSEFNSFYRDYCMFKKLIDFDFNHYCKSIRAYILMLVILLIK